MRRFERLAPPDFWYTFEARWQEDVDLDRDPLSWRHDGQQLRYWFHETVRLPPRNCAYCDGQLGAQSTHGIDHFRPKTRWPKLCLTWNNLYPCCTACNQAKGDKWDERLIHPDTDPVETWVQYEPVTGALEPRPGLTADVHERVSRSLEIFGLNRPDLRSSRRLMVRYHATSDVYRFIET